MAINTQQRIGKFIVQSGIATDTTTNLTWLRFTYGQSWQSETPVGDIKLVTRETAKSVAEQYNKQGGYLDIFDWRLPKINELETLIDMFKGKPDNYINVDVFPKNYHDYWSSDNMWCMSFVCAEACESIDGETPRAVRLVRGA